LVIIKVLVNEIVYFEKNVHVLMIVLLLVKRLEPLKFLGLGRNEKCWRYKIKDHSSVFRPNVTLSLSGRYNINTNSGFSCQYEAVAVGLWSVSNSISV
jgi:hypothetical protein